MGEPKTIAVRQAALSLPPADRLALATELLGSVEGTDSEWEAAWSAELDRRAVVADVHSDQGIPWRVVLAKMEGMLLPKP